MTRKSVAASVWVGDGGWLGGGLDRRAWLSALTVLMIRTLLAAAFISPDIGAMIRGTAVEPMTGVLMGVSAEHYASERRKDTRDRMDPEAVAHGWGAPRDVGIVADHMGCPC
jgi:hypothetical protein